MTSPKVSILVDRFIHEAPREQVDELFLKTFKLVFRTLMYVMSERPSRDRTHWRSQLHSLAPFLRQLSFGNPLDDGQRYRVWQQIDRQLTGLSQWGARGFRSELNKRLASVIYKLHAPSRYVGDIFLHGGLGERKRATLVQDFENMLEVYQVAISVFAETEGDFLSEAESFIRRKGFSKDTPRVPIDASALAAIDAYIANGLLIEDE